MTILLTHIQKMYKSLNRRGEPVRVASLGVRVASLGVAQYVVAAKEAVWVSGS